MILAPLAAATLMVSVATGPIDEPNGSSINLSTQQKNAALQPLVRSATECIARVVAADPHYQMERSSLGDVIVASMPPCMGPVRAMIDTYDRYFGMGSGEEFFMGPYLDVLPAAVTKWISDGSASATAP